MKSPSTSPTKFRPSSFAARTVPAVLGTVLMLAAAGCSTTVTSSATSVSAKPAGPPTTPATVTAAGSATAPTNSTTGSSNPAAPLATYAASAAPNCEATVRKAAFAIEIEDQVKLLDAALLQCGSVEQLTAEVDKYPGFTGYTTNYMIVNRCDTVEDETIRNGAVCSVAAPSTTVPNAVANDVVYVGKTLDGRTVELRPTPELPFIDDAPAEIKRTVDIAIADGCDGVFNRRDFWYAAFKDGGTDTASIFAQHAINMAQLLNCGVRPLPSSNLGDSSATSGN